MVVTSLPNTFTVPASGCSKPIMIFISTDLPLPDLPSTTKFSPLQMSTVTPSSTKLLPKVFFTSDKEMTILSAIFSIVVLLISTNRIHDLYDDHFFQKNKEHRYYHGRIGGFAHPLCALSSIEARITACNAYCKAKNNGF